MSRTIDYSALTGKAKYDKALQDCRDWINDDARFDKLIELLAIELERGSKDEYLLMCLSMAGIQGFPAQCMIDEADGGYIEA